MRLYELTRRLVPLSALALVAALGLAHAQQQATEYEPSVGQEGKDVVWVPTSQAVVDKMLDLAKVVAGDIHYDLGSGDGRTVISAAKRGATAIGIEFNPDMVALSRRNAAKEGVTDKVTFLQGDIFESDFSKATVITLFLLPDLNVRLRPKILDMKPGVRVVSNSFDMGDWTPEERVTVSDGCSQFCTTYFWIVPAKVQGRWTMAGGELDLKQDYQMLTGTMKGGQSGAISGAKMTGDQIAFTVGKTSYVGRVTGNVMEGTAKSATGETKWRAQRTN